MAVQPLTSALICVDAVNVTAYANSINVTMDADTRDVTTFASGGSRQMVSTLGMVGVEIAGFDDDVATGGPNDLMQFASIGALNTWTVSIPGTTAGDAAVFGQGRTMTATPISGAVGDVAAVNIGITGTSREVVGLLLHPAAARTTTGSGTAVAFTTPTAGQALHYAAHVHSVSGAGNIVFTIQTDDNGGFSSGTTRITSSAITAVGAVFGSLSGALAGETHIRVGWTITGFTSVTFSVSAGVALPSPATP